MSNDQQSFRSRRGRFSFSIPSHLHDCMSPESRVPDPESYQSYPRYHELGGPLKVLEAVYPSPFLTGLTRMEFGWTPLQSYSSVG